MNEAMKLTEEPEPTAFLEKSRTMISKGMNLEIFTNLVQMANWLLRSLGHLIFKVHKSLLSTSILKMSYHQNAKKVCMHRFALEVYE